MAKEMGQLDLLLGNWNCNALKIEGNLVSITASVFHTLLHAGLFIYVYLPFVMG